MRIGIDYRPALVNREGIGRYTRELVRALHGHQFDPNLGLFGYTLRAPRFSKTELGLEDSRAELLRLRLPSRALPWILDKMRKGVDDLVGGCQVYHHTQPNMLHVREAAEVVTIFDCIPAMDADNPNGPGYMDPEVAKRMTANAKRMAQQAQLVLVPCRFVGAEVVMSLGVSPERVFVTPLGCDHVLEHLPPGGFPPPGTPFILTVSRVDRRKNHLRMLEAFENLVREGFPHHWIVVGPVGFGHEEFAAALAQSPAANRVEWRREASDREVVQLYSQADLLLWPSLSEGFGLPPVEAMACGTPVLTSIVTSLPEVCGDAAMLVEPTDSGEIFEGARRLLTEQDLREEYISKGSRRARELTWAECARTTLMGYSAARDRAKESEA